MDNKNEFEVFEISWSEKMKKIIIQTIQHMTFAKFATFDLL